jgi:beta-glucosidase
VAKRLGDRLWSVAPINEPWCVAWLSHFMGIHAPGLRDIRAAAHAMHHVLYAHGRAIEVLRANGVGNLGAVCNLEYPIAATDSPEDAIATQRYDAIYNQFFVSGIFKGRYPDAVMEGLEPHMPKGWQDDFATIQQPLDWLGLNYYTCKRVAAGSGPWPSYDEPTGPLPKTEMGWEIYPDGLLKFLRRIRQEYTGDLPLYVTENGMAAPDRLQPSGEVRDEDRIDYLARHLGACQTAIAEGVPLKGYFAWSLLDNYEWSLGYEKRFGLVHVDFDTLQRRPKESWHQLRAALAGNR